MASTNSLPSFVYNGYNFASLFNLYITDINKSETTVSYGGKMKQNTTKPSSGYRSHFHGITYEEDLTFSFTCYYMPECSVNIANHYLSSVPQGNFLDIQGIMKYLTSSSGYHKFQFTSDLLDDYKFYEVFSVWYNAYLEVQVLEYNHRPYGFEITVHCDSPYGYISGNINQGSSTSETFTIKNYSSVPCEIYPNILVKLQTTNKKAESHCNSNGLGIQITSKSDEENLSYLYTSQFYGTASNSNTPNYLYLDGNTQQVMYLSSLNNSYNSLYQWYWNGIYPKLIRHDDLSNTKCDITCLTQRQYEENKLIIWRNDLSDNTIKITYDMPVYPNFNIFEKPIENNDYFAPINKNFYENTSQVVMDINNNISITTNTTDNTNYTMYNNTTNSCSDTIESITLTNNITVNTNVADSVSSTFS